MPARRSAAKQLRPTRDLEKEIPRKDDTDEPGRRVRRFSESMTRPGQSSQLLLHRMRPGRN